MAESGENSPPLFIPESWPAMFDQVFLFFTFTMTFIRYFTFTFTMKTILRRALKILGSVQLLRQSCPHCLWSFKLSKTTPRCKKILNRITLMQQRTGEYYMNRSRQSLVPQRTSTGRQGLLLLFSRTLRSSSSRFRGSFYLSHCC